MTNEPETKFWNGMKIVRISDCPAGFMEWLAGQTLPFVLESCEPMGWAYYSDYERFINNLPVID